MIDEQTKSEKYELVNVPVSFAALKKPITSEYGTSYAVSVMIDKSKISDPNTLIIRSVDSKLTKGKSKVMEDKETGLVTNNALLSFYTKEPIMVFDSLGKQVIQENIPLVGEGSIVNIQFRLVKTKFGMSKYLDGVQIVKLVEFVPKPREVKFGMVDGGFVDNAEEKRAEQEALVPTFDSVFGK